MLAPVRAGSCRMRSEVLKAKVCLVGDLAVGKTSLIRRFVLDAVEKVVGRVPVLIAINKADLEDHADYGEKEIRGIAEAYDADFIRTSAKTADGVEEAFQRLGAVVAQRQLEGVAGEEE